MHLGDLVPLSRSRDGDCLHETPRVAERLSAMTGVVSATKVMVWGELEGLLCFAHLVVQVVIGPDPGGTFIVDTTASQFDASLPYLLVDTPDDYLARLREATGVGLVRFVPTGIPAS